MLDMVQPVERERISLGDLKKCKMTPIFFDTFFNLEKYLDHEQRDPFASQRDHDADGHEVKHFTYVKFIHMKFLMYFMFNVNVLFLFYISVV